MHNGGVVNYVLKLSNHRSELKSAICQSDSSLHLERREPNQLLYMLAAMRRAVVSLSSPDLLSDAGARGASLRAVDDIAFGDCAAAVVLVEILRAHLEEMAFELNRLQRGLILSCSSREIARSV